MRRFGKNTLLIVILLGKINLDKPEANLGIRLL